MPKISELGNAAALDGTEWIDVVQGGVNVKVALSTLLNSQREVSMGNARWIRVSGETAPINEVELSTNSGDWSEDGFSATAQVSSTKDSADILWWSYSFEEFTVLGENGHQVHMGTLGNGEEITLDEGLYRINLYDAGASGTGTAEYSVNGGNSLPLTVVGEDEQFSVPVGESHVVSISATEGSHVIIVLIGGFSSGGDARPTISDGGNQLTVSYSGQDTPKNMVLTATARIYRDSVMVAESDPITLTVTYTSNDEPPAS